MDLLRNTAYNPMIYITFFIGILIDKRGGKRRERGGKTRIQLRIQIRIPTAPREKEVPRAHTGTQHRHTAYTQRHRTKRGMHRAPSHRQQKRYEPATTPPPAHHPHHHVHTATKMNARARTHTRAHRRSGTHTGAHRRGLGERHPSVTTPETTCDHPP